MFNHPSHPLHDEDEDLRLHVGRSLRPHVDGTRYSETCDLRDQRRVEESARCSMRFRTFRCRS